jgi:hypothetical protein
MLGLQPAWRPKNAADSTCLKCEFPFNLHVRTGQYLACPDKDKKMKLANSQGWILSSIVQALSFCMPQRKEENARAAKIFKVLCILMFQLADLATDLIVIISSAAGGDWRWFGVLLSGISCQSCIAFRHSKLHVL